VEYLAFLLLGIGSGAVFSALGVSLVVTYRSSGVVNFGTGAVGLYAAYVYSYLRQGQFLQPIPGLPATVGIGTSSLGFFPAFALSLLVAAVLGALLYVLVFRPLRSVCLPSRRDR